MKNPIRFLRLLFCLASIVSWQYSQSQTIELAGIWRFTLDPLKNGIGERGVLPNNLLPGSILLPGSTDEGGYGYENRTITSLRLTRTHQYSGVAWYEKEIYIPDSWKNKEIQLFMERVHWESQVWVNGEKAGKRESLSVPHRYDITPYLKPGKKNKIRIRVDNGKIYDIGGPHAISEETQTNWNGIVGKIELRARDKVQIEDVQIYPDIRLKQAEVRISISNLSSGDAKGILLLYVNHRYQQIVLAKKRIDFSGTGGLIKVNAILPLARDLQLWDEFNPKLYELHAVVTAAKGYKDSSTVVFGMRDFSTSGTQFTINNRPVFIRANVNSAEFPLTGYPATDTTYWMHVFTVCKDYGLNAMRFHTWCPPEAAFFAADKMGFYLQIENADWRFNIGQDTAANRFLSEEADRILKAYGNHPSFVMFCEGNELVGRGRDSFLTSLITRWKKEDTRRLYTGSSGYPIMSMADYIDLYGPRAQHWKEGLKGRLNAQPYHTDLDYSAEVVKYNKPLISHEVGQWCVYPDFKQISKYTGVLKPYNYALFRESLREHRMPDQSEEFMMASGKFQVLLKKEEIEALLRTPGLGGYQLLQLQDFPGQGTAPVGVVDDFWDSKPYVNAADFRRFQSSRVLLLRSSSFILTSDDVIRATAQLANYGDGEMKNVVIKWVLKYPDGKIYDQGSFAKKNIPIGSPFEIGQIAVVLNRIKDASRLDLELSVAHSDVSNHWSFWVYPKNLPVADTAGFLIAHSFTKQVEETLDKGGAVLLLADTSKINTDLSPSFSGISWNTVWSGTPPDKLGILCDPTRAVFKYFPTRYYSTWQWWDLVRHSRPLKLNHFPSNVKPLIQMIPDWNKNNKIGLLFEAKVGKGRLLMTSMGLLHQMQERPVARQMLYSLEKYAASEAFDPETTLSMAAIKQLFKNEP